MVKSRLRKGPLGPAFVFSGGGQTAVGASNLHWVGRQPEGVLDPARGGMADAAGPLAADPDPAARATHGTVAPGSVVPNID